MIAIPESQIEKRAEDTRPLRNEFGSWEGGETTLDPE